MIRLLFKYRYHEGPFETGSFSVYIENGIVTIDPAYSGSMPLDFEQLLEKIREALPYLNAPQSWDKFTSDYYDKQYSHLYVRLRCGDEERGYVVIPRINGRYQVISMQVPLEALDYLHERIGRKEKVTFHPVSMY